MLGFDNVQRSHCSLGSLTIPSPHVAAGELTVMVYGQSSAGVAVLGLSIDIIAVYHHAAVNVWLREIVLVVFVTSTNGVVLGAGPARRKREMVNIDGNGDAILPFIDTDTCPFDQRVAGLGDAVNVKSSQRGSIAGATTVNGT